MGRNYVPFKSFCFPKLLQDFLWCLLGFAILQTSRQENGLGKQISELNGTLLPLAFTPKAFCTDWEPGFVEMPTKSYRSKINW